MCRESCMRAQERLQGSMGFTGCCSLWWASGVLGLRTRPPAGRGCDVSRMLTVQAQLPREAQRLPARAALALWTCSCTRLSPSQPRAHSSACLRGLSQLLCRGVDQVRHHEACAVWGQRVGLQCRHRCGFLWHWLVPSLASPQTCPATGCKPARLCEALPHRNHCGQDRPRREGAQTALSKWPSWGTFLAVAHQPQLRGQGGASPE